MHLHTNPKTIENFSLFLINESVSLFLSGRRLISQSLAPELQAIEEEFFYTNRHPLTWSQLTVNDGCFLQTTHNTGHDAQAKDKVSVRTLPGERVITMSMAGSPLTNGPKTMSHAECNVPLSGDKVSVRTVLIRATQWR